MAPSNGDIGAVLSVTLGEPEIINGDFRLVISDSLLIGEARLVIESGVVRGGSVKSPIAFNPPITNHQSPTIH
jgi:hypothetical protein